MKAAGHPELGYRRAKVQPGTWTSCLLAAVVKHDAPSLSFDFGHRAAALWLDKS